MPINDDRRGSTDRDRHGFDENRDYPARVLAKFVPQAAARRALEVSVGTDRDRYERGEPVEFTVAIRTRLPVPITVATPRRRLWGWRVDGELEASDEPRRASDAPGAFVFRASERKVFRRTWSGRFRREGRRTRWIDPAPGTHEITAFVATEAPQPTDSVSVVID